MKPNSLMRRNCTQKMSEVARSYYRNHFWSLIDNLHVCRGLDCEKTCSRRVDMISFWESISFYCRTNKTRFRVLSIRPIWLSVKKVTLAFMFRYKLVDKSESFFIYQWESHFCKDGRLNHHDDQRIIENFLLSLVHKHRGNEKACFTR